MLFHFMMGKLNVISFYDGLVECFNNTLPGLPSLQILTRNNPFVFLASHRSDVAANEAGHSYIQIKCNFFVNSAFNGPG